MTTAPFGTFPQSAAMRILLVPLGGLEDQNPALFDRYCALFDTVPTLPLSGMTSPGRWSQKHSPFRHFNWLSSTNALQFRWVRFRKSKSGATEGGRGAAALRGGQADPWRDFQAHRRIYGAVGVLHYPSFAAAGLSEADARAEMEAALVEYDCGHAGFDNVVWRICVFDQPFDDYNRRVHLLYWKQQACRNALIVQTLIFMHIDKLWAGAQKTRSLNVPYDLQKYFTLSGSGMLETSRFLKQMLAVAKDTDLYREAALSEADKVQLELGGDGGGAWPSANFGFGDGEALGI